MKAKFFFSISALFLTISVIGQKSTVELTFRAENNGQYIPLDSIFIENISQDGDTTLYAPDTLLMIDYILSIGDKKTVEKTTLSVSQNCPNPFEGQTSVSLYLPGKENIIITVRDILGRELDQYKNTLQQGNHSFSFYSGNEKYYLLTVTDLKTSQQLKC